MKPRFRLTIANLCCLALLLWGAHTTHTGLMLIAIPMVLMIAGRQLIQWQWNLSLSNLKRLIQLCGGLLGILLIVLLMTQRSFSIIYLLLQWLPVCAFPLILAQAYCPSLPFLLRLLFTPSHVLKEKIAIKQTPINLYYPYFALCLLSASSSNWNALSASFYGSIFILVALLLWKYRPQRTNPILWVCMLLLVGGMGFVGHLQLHQLQAKLEQDTAPWLSGVSGDSVNAYQTSTHIGSIEAMKLSDAIAFRVETEKRLFSPLLLREATYNKYGSASWIAMQSKFLPIPPNPDGKTWKFSTIASTSTSLKISTNLDTGKGVLKLPNGTSEIHELPADHIRKNQYGTVEVEGTPGAIAYQLQFNPNQSGDSPPTTDDLQIPDQEIPAIEQTLDVLNLNGETESEAQVMTQLSSYFEKHFRYSLQPSDSSESSTPLSAFLLKNRSGHCEYFASATTLLLRGAGIPARYAVGYSVHEFSPLEGQYIVRSRNAHAWVMAYVNGTWQSFDTTPPDWTAQEDSTASPLQTISDLWAFVGFKLASMGVWGYGGLAIAPVTAFLLWKWSRRFWIRRSVVPAIVGLEPIPPSIKAGLDSEFYLIEQKLDELNLNRIASESLEQWLMRLKIQLPESEFEALRTIIKLHNRYRFDPQGIEVNERERLRSLSQSWLDLFHRRNPLMDK